jgi:hypothetical protein
MLFFAVAILSTVNGTEVSNVPIAQQSSSSSAGYKIPPWYYPFWDRLGGVMIEEGVWVLSDQVPFLPANVIRTFHDNDLPKSLYDPFWDDLGWSLMGDGFKILGNTAGIAVNHKSGSTLFSKIANYPYEDPGPIDPKRIDTETWAEYGENIVSAVSAVDEIVSNKDEISKSFQRLSRKETSYLDTSQSNAQKITSSVDMPIENDTISFGSQQNERSNPMTIKSPGSNIEPGENVLTLSPRFEWFGDPLADYYVLYISKYPYGTENIIFDSSKNYGPLYSSSFNLPSGYLQEEMKYRWNMKAHGSYGWSGISNTLYFRTSTSNQKKGDANSNGTQNPLVSASEIANIQQCGRGRQLSESELASIVKNSFPSGIISKTGENIQVVAYAVARAESSRNPTACGDCGKKTCSDDDNPNTSSIGLWQINLYWHPKYDRSWLFDPNNNAQAALEISSIGQEWQWWSTYKDGTYLNWVPEAKNALGLAIVPESSDKEVPSEVQQNVPTNPPLLNSPGSSSEPGNSIDTLSPTFTWSGDSNADYYALYISKYPYGSSNIIFDSTTNVGRLSGTSFNLPSGYLQEGMKYRWNMKAHSSSGWSGISNTLYFQTSSSDQKAGDANSIETQSPANPPIIDSPGSSSEPGNSIDTLSPTFTWSGDSNADYYALYISKYPYGSSNIIFDSTTNVGRLSGTFFDLPSGYLQEGMKYRWNMKAHSSSGWSSISNTLYFQTSSSDQKAGDVVLFETKEDTQVALTLYVHEGSKNGPTISGAQVVGQDGSGNAFQGTTDSNGYMVLTGYPGTWSFTASAYGYSDNGWSQDISSTCTKHASLQKIEVYQEPEPVYQPPSQVTLTLYVHEGSKNGPTISGAQVVGQDGSGNAFQGTTDSNGYMVLTGYPGTWSFTASAYGYSDNGWSQDISSTCTKHASLQKIEVYQEPEPVYQPPSQVTLTLYVHEGSKNGPTISGAQVVGQDGSGNAFQGTTDSNGYMVLTGYPGTWSFTASAYGYSDNGWSQDISSTCTKHASLQK